MRRYIELLSEKHIEVIDEIYAEEICIGDGPTMPGSQFKGTVIVKPILHDPFIQHSTLSVPGGLKASKNVVFRSALLRIIQQLGIQCLNGL
jgi:hypothetical protein